MSQSCGNMCEVRACESMSFLSMYAEIPFELIISIEQKQFILIINIDSWSQCGVLVWNRNLDHLLVLCSPVTVSGLMMKFIGLFSHFHY